MSFTEEIFFDDSDMTTEEMMWNVALWYGEAFNPIAFLDPQRLTTKRGIAQKVAATGIVTGAMWGVAQLGGGGATAWRAKDSYSFAKGMAMKIDTYRAVGVAAGQTMGYLARNALPALSYAAAIGAMAAATHAWYDTVRSLDWVPNYYIGP